MTSKGDLIQIYQELSRRKEEEAVKNEFWISPTLTPLQQSFIKDKARFKLARACRQSGKTFTVIQYLIYAALSKHKSRCLLIGLTMKNVKMLGWDGLKETLTTNNIEHMAYEAALGITFPNGSKIALVAADQSKSIDRLRGSQWDLVCVDECAFSSEADKLITVLLPTLAVRKGVLVMTSSPGPCTGFFYEADEGSHKKRWSRYFWRMEDNPAMQLPASAPIESSQIAKLAEFFKKDITDPLFNTRAMEEISTILEMRFGNNLSDPGFRQEYLGQWVRDHSVLLYHFNYDKNIIPRRMIPTELIYAAAIDLGWNDKNAITVLGLDPKTNRVYVVDTWARGKITVDEIVPVIKDFMDKYELRYFGADMGGYGKGIAEEMRIRHRLPIIPAVKHEKTVGIAAMNSSFYAGNLFVCEDLTALIAQWGKIERDPATGIETKSATCDLADSCLYAFRFILQYSCRHRENKVELEETMEDKMYNRSIADTVKEMEREKNDPW